MFGSRRRMVRSADESQVRRQFHGSIDGVQFELRHPSLPPAEWSCPRFFTGRSPDHPGYYLGSAPVGDNPTDWWPFDSAEAMQEVIDQAEQNARDEGMEMLYPGDRVSIAAVEKVRPPDWRLAPPPDREFAVVTLQVTRAHGATEPLRSRTFYHRGSTLGEVEEWEVSSHLFDRLRPLVNEGDGEARAVFELSERAERERHALHDFLMERVPSGPMQGLLDPRFHVAASLDQLFNLAALYGYRQGRLEADLAMKPLALETLEREARAVAGGEKRGQRLREEVLETYGGPALRLALEMIAAGVSNKAHIIREIRRRWHETGLAASLLPVSDRAIQNFLDQHEAFAALSGKRSRQADVEPS